MQYFSHGSTVELNCLMAEKQFEIQCRDMLCQSRVLLSESLDAAVEHCSVYVSVCPTGVNGDRTHGSHCWTCLTFSKVTVTMFW